MVKDDITRFKFSDGSWIMGPQGGRTVQPVSGAMMTYASDEFEGASGSSGRIEFEPHARMPLHVHLSERLYDADGNPIKNPDAGFKRNKETGECILDENGKKQPLTGAEIKEEFGDTVSRKNVTEYITIDPAGGPMLLMIGEHTYFVMPGFRCSIAGGTPHTWSGVPAGIKMPDGSVSDGKKAIMHFLYGEKIVGFTAVKNTDRIHGSTNDIEVQKPATVFPEKSKEEICALPYVWENEIQKDGLQVADHVAKCIHLNTFRALAADAARALGLGGHATAQAR